MRAPSVCNTPGCPVLVPRPGHCPAHARPAWQGATPFDIPRWEWTRRRKQAILRAHGRCELRTPGCLDIATEVDHITPRANGGTSDLNNLRAACHPCHQARTNAERRRPGG